MEFGLFDDGNNGEQNDIGMEKIIIIFTMTGDIIFFWAIAFGRL